jgi:hypothetical protein
MSVLLAATSITIEHDWTDVVVALSAAAGALAATTALIYTGRQLQLGRRSAEAQRQAGREQLAYRYFERLMHPDMIPFTQRWVALSKIRTADPDTGWKIPFLQRHLSLSKLSPEDPDTKWKSWRESPLEDRLMTLVVPNLLEELAGMYHRGLVDQAVTKDFLAGLIVAWWEQGEWFIRRCRVDGSDEVFAQWEQLYVLMNTSA